jgi:ribosomal protein S25
MRQNHIPKTQPTQKTRPVLLQPHMRPQMEKRRKLQTQRNTKKLDAATPETLPDGNRSKPQKSRRRTMSGIPERIKEHEDDAIQAIREHIPDRLTTYHQISEAMPMGISVTWMVGHLRKIGFIEKWGNSSNYYWIHHNWQPNGSSEGNGGTQ